MATGLETGFNEAMLDLYWRIGRESGYWANYYLRKVRKEGGVLAARYFLRQRGLSEGLITLAKLGRLDMSVEQLILEPPWTSLFTGEERAMASAKLAEAREHSR